MSVWKSDEKLLIFASLISPSQIILFEKIVRCESYFQVSSQCFIWS